MLNIMTRPPLGVVRQFSRAVFADRLIGDELMRMTMARVSIDPASSSSSVVDVMSAFLHSWRMALQERPSRPVLFSDAALIDALPAPPDDARLLLLLVDVMGLTPQQAAEVVGVSENPATVLKLAREDLRIDKQARAIVVEDEPLIAADIRGILERLGVEVAGEASSAEEAVKVATRSKPDIILADYNLDGRNTGIDAVVEINESQDCPVVFITGFPDRVLQGDEIEPDFVISKPYTPENVRAAVVHCLDARRA
ncbi:response regulator [Parvularcula lutaonensis]|uniref:Response regulator n=1 Tax=Parvularcula lutaonensis TaxID=491923 RepID=A0ABV7MCW8_9PROT|nr:response regulator [Parvularcula lutaonensis]GGY51841.1 two-component response regulator [Parvularcula lutaonensis]